MSTRDPGTAGTTGETMVTCGGNGAGGGTNPLVGGEGVSGAGMNSGEGL